MFERKKMEKLASLPVPGDLLPGADWEVKLASCGFLSL